MLLTKSDTEIALLQENLLQWRIFGPGRHS
uniref:Uncharacterized protein n=1 Tax=Anguilla anguilla TaxID=7936 RepID=A0A0E9TB36_ANGAN